MFRSFSLFLSVIALVFSSMAAPLAEPRDIHSSAAEVTVNMSRAPLRVLLEKGNFDGGRLIRAAPVESVKFGKRGLWLVRPAKDPRARRRRAKGADAHEQAGGENSVPHGTRTFLTVCRTLPPPKVSSTRITA